jgi:PAS domain S-box-containing protein
VTDAGEVRRSQLTRAHVRSVFVALCGVVACIGTFIYELFKEIFAPQISRWGSHTITIAFVTLLASGVARLAYQTAMRLQAVMTVLKGRGERFEAALHGIVKAVPAPAFVVMRDHTLMTCNEALATRLGRTVDEVRGRNVFELLPDQRLARERVAHVDRVFETGVAETFRDVNGGRHYANHVCPVLGPDGNVWAVGIIAIDETDLRQAQEQLAGKEELLRFGLEASRLGVWEWDIGADTVTVSPEAIALMGGHARAWRGSFTDFLRYVEPVDRARVESSLRTAAAGRTGSEPERFRARPIPNRTMKWVEVQGRQFRGPEGRVRLIGTVGDATAQVEAEDRRRRAELALQAVTKGTAGYTGHAFFSSLAEVLAHTLNARWVLVARSTGGGQAMSLAGWAGGPTAPGPLPAHGPLDEALAARWATAVDPAGTQVPHVVAVPIVGLDGRALGLVAAMDTAPPVDLDTTRWLLALCAVRAGAEIQRMDKEDEILSLNADLERRVVERTIELTSANRELEAFSYSVSHDLRAPLRSIDGFAMALMEDFGDALEPAARQYVQIVRRESQRMGQIIDDLLGLARLTRSALNRGPVDLTALCTDIVDALRRREPGRGVTVSIETGMMAQGDANLLRIALENLIGNAWKFTSRTPHAIIEIGAGGTPSQPTFHVRDNGVGFDASMASKLFQPFARLHAATEYEGTGLGLATVARIVKRHGGQISASGQPGKGAEITWSL